MAVSGMMLFAGNRIHAMVDSADWVPESDETNNVADMGQISSYDPAGGEWLPMVEWQWDDPNSFGVGIPPRSRR